MMTREETKRILMVVQAAYPNFSPSDKTVTVDTWHKFLGEYPYEQVDAAIGAYIRSDTSGFAPGIGMVVEKIQNLFQPENLNEMAAWQMVLKAMRNSIYHSEEEFAKLPPVVQKSVVSPGQLREWAMAEDIDGSWMNVAQSNFMRTYRAEATMEKEMRKLSPDLLRLVAKTAGKASVDRAEHKKISAREERGSAEEETVPMPERLRERCKTLLGTVV